MLISGNSYSQNYFTGVSNWPSLQSDAPGGHGNIRDAQTGGGTVGWRGGIFGGPEWRPNEGYAIDFDRNGRYDRGRDGVMAFDTNRDGRYDQNEVRSTNDMMRAAGGNYDFDRNGQVTMAETMQGMAYRARYNQLDYDRDGRLSANEISYGGGGIWMDHNGDGTASRNEQYSAFNVPNGFGPSRRVDGVDPFWGTSQTTSNWGGPNPGPWVGGYPGMPFRGADWAML